jgi:hypothetical protein
MSKDDTAPEAPETCSSSAALSRRGLLLAGVGVAGGAAAQLLAGDALAGVDIVASEEVLTVLPIASTHSLVEAGRGATFVAFAGTDPVVLTNWISISTHT